MATVEELKVLEEKLNSKTREPGEFDIELSNAKALVSIALSLDNIVYLLQSSPTGALGVEVYHGG
jgi:hypothetical protein